MALDPEKIRKEGITIIEEFSKKLQDIPETNETHYVTDMKNVLRSDEPPQECEGFRDKMKKLAPTWDGDSLVAEKGE